ncbi:hypothetical protein D3C81_1569170 [compost metagenome]
MAVLLVDIARRIVDLGIALELFLDGEGGDPRPVIAFSAQHQAFALFGLADPVERAVGLRDRCSRGAAILDECPGHTAEGEVCFPGVVPNLRGLIAEHEDLALRRGNGHDLVRKPCLGREVQRIEIHVQEGRYVPLVAARTVQE